MRAADLHQLTRMLYQSVVDPSKWQPTLTAMADTLTASHVLVSARSDTAEPQFLSARVDDLYLRDFWQKLDESPFRDVPGTAPTGTVFQSAAVLDRRVYIPSEFYQSIIRPMGGHHALLGLPYRSRREKTFLAVCRPHHRGPFADNVAARLQILMPHIEMALRLQRRLAHDESAAWHREQALDVLDIGVVLLDKRQRPLIVNRKARELTAVRKDLSLSRAGFNAGNGSLSRTLQRAIAAAVDFGSLDGTSLCVRFDRAGSVPLLLRVLPIPDRDDLLDSYPGAAIAVFIDTLDGSRVQPERLRAWFGLSAREAELAALLAGGRDLAASAQAMGIGIETARTHLERLFSKTDTRRQAELVSVLLRAAWRL